MKLLGYDCETHLIEKPSRLAPPVVCAQFQLSGQAPYLLDRDAAESDLRRYLEDPEVHFVGCNIAYDFACAMMTWPGLIPLIFKAYDNCRIHDVMIREKLISLGRHGYIDYRPTPDGGTQKLWYNLGAICLRRLGIELDGKDKDDEDSWRLKFGYLDGVPVSEYPSEAISYALDDVAYLEQLFYSQQQEGESNAVPNTHPLLSEPLHCAAALSLYLMTCWGCLIDPEERAKVQAMLEAELTPERLEPLFVSGILRRPVLPAPHKNQMKRVEKLIGNEDPSKHREMLEENGVKFTAGKAASRDMKRLREIILEVAVANDVELKLTDGGYKYLEEQEEGYQLTEAEYHKYLATNDEFLQDLEIHDARLEAYCHRQRLDKLVSTELPRIQAPRVHGNFDVLKETGRTSSYDPNLQNVDPRVRPCYVPSPGHVFLSVDYSSIELVCLAQKQLQLFGHSVLGDLIKNGVDPHAYLAAQMAPSFAPEELERLTGKDLQYEDPMTRYSWFVALKDGDEEQEAFFGHWRTFAKPVGLGYPGGLGPETLRVLAKGTYGIVMSLEEAAKARELWHETFPEMSKEDGYFAWINNDCQTAEGTYWYMSPCGMLRNHTTYCAAANGAALQTPAAEGAKGAMFELSWLCYDHTRENLLYGCRPWNFVHDQVILEIPHDDLMHERALEVSRVMVQGMQQIITDLPVRVEACLTERWYKQAKPVYDDQGRLQIWRP